MLDRWLWRTLTLALLTILATAPLYARSRRLDPFLDHVYDDWLASVWFLASDAERTAFQALEEDLPRERFIRRFWAERGDVPSDPTTAPSSRLARWRENSREVERRFGRFDRPQSWALMIAGKPPRTTRVECDDVTRRMEIWSYDEWHAGYQTGDHEHAAAFSLLFFLTDRLDYGTYAHWAPAEGMLPLTLGGPGRLELSVEALEQRMSESGCLRDREAADILGQALRHALGPDALRQTLAPARPDAAWINTFVTSLAEGGRPERLPASPLEIIYPGYYNDQRTIVQGRVHVPAATMERGAEGLLFDRVVMEGDIRRAGGTAAVVDVFRVVHDLAGAAPTDGAVPLSFYRRLRPGQYTLDIRVEDAYGLGLLREQRALEVPKLDEPAEPPAGSRGFVSLTRELVGRLQTLPSVEVLSPGDDTLVGSVEVSAVTTGGPIGSVTFELNGIDAGQDHEPPFTAQLDLGSVPAQHEVTAIAHDPAGRPLARSTRRLNDTPSRFAVRLLEPRRGAPSHRALAAVDVPAGETLDRLEIFVDRTLIATLREPPWEAPLPSPLPASTTFVRAVATLESGAINEDLAMVGTATPVDELDVRLVELFTSVTDNNGRTVSGLTADDFTIREDNAPQTILRFDTVSNLPINVALMMDVSASMRRKVDVASASARRFFETVLTSKDTASLVTFSHDIERVGPVYR